MSAPRRAPSLGARLGELLDHPALVRRVPGRSPLVLAALLLAAAVVLGMLPWFSGPGIVASLLALAGGALIVRRELGFGGSTGASGRPVAEVPRQGVLLPAFAAFVAVEAFLMLDLGLVPLLWLVAAALLVRSQWASWSAGRFAPPREWARTQRVLGGSVVLCLLTLFGTWQSTSSSWTGGLRYGYRYNSSAGGYQWSSEWEPMQHFWAGFAFSGRSQAGVALVVAALVALLFWAVRRRDGAPSRLSVRLAWAAVAGAFVWVMATAGGETAPRLFVLGLVGIAYGVFRIGHPGVRLPGAR